MLFPDTIKPLIEAELRLFEERFSKAFLTDNLLLTEINHYIAQENGKRLRPMIVLLAARLCAESTQASIEGAVSLELLHTASLIHDDIVDNTMTRRGRDSVNARWDNRIAVLVGDFLLSKSLLHATQTQKLNIVQLISNIGIQLSDGELLQLSNTRKTNLSQDDYFKIIRKKTALLFASCAKIGALSVVANKQETNALWQFGEALGTCFQIKDDIFDYSENAKIGKPTGNDIREGKMTLPLIFALENADLQERENIISLIENGDLSEGNVKKIIRFANENGGVEYATAQMEIYKNKAIEEMAHFPDSPFKTALIACAAFAAERNS